MVFRKKELSIIEQAEEANKVLCALGLPKHTQSGRQIREALALELLSSEYESIQGYKAGAFVNQMGMDTITNVKKILADEGILTRKLEHKKK